MTVPNAHPRTTAENTPNVSPYWTPFWLLLINIPCAVMAWLWPLPRSISDWTTVNGIFCFCIAIVSAALAGYYFRQALEEEQHAEKR